MNVENGERNEGWSGVAAGVATRAVQVVGRHARTAEGPFTVSLVVRDGTFERPAGGWMVDPSGLELCLQMVHDGIVNALSIQPVPLTGEIRIIASGRRRRVLLRKKVKVAPAW